MDLMLRRVAVLLVLSLAATPAEAKQEWTCKKGKLERKILVEAKTYGKAPCKVLYKKPTERKPDKEVGHAMRQFPFCEEKAEALALKLQNSGWECARQDS
jgi:hypothetical protein